MNKQQVVERLLEKAEDWSDLANFRKGEGLHEEATEYYIRAHCFSEAAILVETYLLDR